jgi:hypothetical protein
VIVLFFVFKSKLYVPEVACLSKIMIILFKILIVPEGGEEWCVEGLSGET